jgi:hypothetical protein
MLSLGRATVGAAVATCGFACSPGGAGTASDPAALIVGVQVEDLAGVLSRVHVVVKRDGEVLDDEWLDPRPGTTAFSPKEIAAAGAPGATVDVAVDAFGPSSPTTPLISRLASSHVPTGKKLLRIRLDGRCLVLSSASPTCGAPSTCVDGTCIPADVPDDRLEDYGADWATAPPADACRPLHPGPPEVVLGTGQTDYVPLADGQSVQLELGPQGGHHLWLAVRMKNLRQSGSTTAITSTLDGDPVPGPPMSVVFDFNVDEGSYCKIWGLRYQVDLGAIDLATAYKRFLGKRVSVTVEVTDTTGARAGATPAHQIADKLQCPDGTTSCDP